jgi:hypothetical protein
MAESDFMAYGSIEMIFACLAAFWVALQVLQTVSDFNFKIESAASR